MKKASYIMIRPVFLIGLFVSLSGLMWLALYATVTLGDALLLMSGVLGGLALQIAAVVGARKLPKARFWPGLCMLAAGPATLWNGFAGPGALYGVSAEILRPEAWDSLPPLYYVAIPPMVAGIGVCAAFVVTGLLALSADIAGLGDTREQKQKRKALMAMKPAPATGKTMVAPRSAPGEANPPVPTTDKTLVTLRGAPVEAPPPPNDEAAAMPRSVPGEEDAPAPPPALSPAPPLPDAPDSAARVLPLRGAGRPLRRRGAPARTAAPAPAMAAAPAQGPMQRVRERVRSITQTLRLTAVRQRLARPDEAAPPVGAAEAEALTEDTAAITE